MQKIKNIIQNRDAAKPLNDLCRLAMKEKLLADIEVDLIVCQMEGFNPLEYVKDLRIELENIEKKIENKLKLNGKL